MVASIKSEPSETHGVLARLHGGGPQELDTRKLAGVVRTAADRSTPILRATSWCGPSGLSGGGIGIDHRPLGTSPAARVMERYLGRLSDRLASLTEAIEHADLAAADELLAEVARTSRLHGCRTITRAAETARGATHAEPDDAPVERLRSAIDELSELADEVAKAARSLDAAPELPPRA